MTPAAPARLAGLDIFRGGAVAGMILVNSAGSWDHVWWPLDHAAWHGFTPADLVFPAFLFAMGVALGLSFPRVLDDADRRRLWWRIARRTVALIALGWAITILARGFADLRLLGVLPRLGLCYGLAGGLVLLTARRRDDSRAHLNVAALGAAALLLLAGYMAAMLLVPVPGHGAGALDPAGNLAAWIDRSVLTPAHMWKGGTDASGRVVYDPEGLLSTLPALANVLFGVLAAAMWRAAPAAAPRRLLVAGVALAVMGLALHPLFPINKRLWTSSFALLTTGLSAVLLVASLRAGAGATATRLLAPLHMLGMNAILGYTLGALLNIFGNHRFGGVTPQQWGFAQMQALVGDPRLASFLCACGILLVVLAAVWPFHRRGIHLRL